MGEVDNDWKNLCDGDPDGLAAIYDAHFDFLFAYGKKMATDVAMVEDAIQELFVYLWDKRAGLSPVDNVRPYLTLALKRSIIKKLSKQGKVKLSEDPALLFDHQSAVEQVSFDTSEDIVAQKLQAAIGQLSGRQKEIIYHKYYGGMDYEEIAEIMDLSYQSARNLLHRALKALSKVMGASLFIVSELLHEYKTILEAL